MINGILNVYKEKGYTSHDVVARLRGIVKQKKIGHTGTLDPDAVGVLPVCLGKATKTCDMLTESGKEYEALLLLGQTTDTQDTSGTVLTEKEVTAAEEEVRAAVLSFQGSYSQIPPMYSALKVNGKKLYELARQGIEVERKAREIQIYEIEILEIDLPRVKMRVSCSKGTYIRTLCHDIGEKLGCGGCMAELLRSRAAGFSVEDSKTLDEIEEIVKEERLDEILVSLDQVFSEYAEIIILDEYKKIVYNGNAFRKTHCKEIGKNGGSSRYRVYVEDGTFIGVFDFDDTRQHFKPFKMFLS